MTTTKSYTNIEQSCKLAEILPLESADMCLTFVNNVWNPVCGKMDDIYKLQKDCYEPDYTKDEYVDFDEFEPKIVTCWSLAALISVLPGTITSNDGIAFELNIKKNIIEYSNPSLYLVYKSVKSDNLIDGCYEMVVWLKENGKL